jgi:hypothetical protein
MFNKSFVLSSVFALVGSFISRLVFEVLFTTAVVERTVLAAQE